jgi:hypothetical protein
MRLRFTMLCLAALFWDGSETRPYTNNKGGSRRP